MRYTKAFIPTLREASQDAESANQKLLMRAGFIRKLAPGEYVLLPLGMKVIEKLEKLLNKKVFSEESEQICAAGTANISDKDITHIQSLLNIIKTLGGDINSYKQFPKAFFGVNTYKLDNVRPRHGFLKSKAYNAFDSIEFIMDEKAADERFTYIQSVIEKVFSELNISNIKAVDILSPYNDKSDSILLYEHSAGDRMVLKCPSCGKSMISDTFPCKGDYIASEDEMLEKERIYTPNVGTIDDLIRFLDCTPDKFVKTLLFKADGKVVAALVRGDRELSEVKLKKLLGCNELIMADEETVKKTTGARVGFAGPVGLDALIIADKEVSSLKNIIVGANESDYHLKNVNIKRDFKAAMTGDIRCISADEECPECKGELIQSSGFAIGSICRIGKDSSAKIGLTVLNEGGKQQGYNILNCSINLSALLAAIVEENNDDAGMMLPASVSPYTVAVVIVKPKEELQMQYGEKIYSELKKNGIDVILDDRNDGPGVKFKDIELLGIPYRITVGRKVDQNVVEVKDRVGQMEEVTAEEAILRAGGI